MGTEFSTERYLEELYAATGIVASSGVEHVVTMIIEARSAGRMVFLAGNGGSAATANHFACDLMKNVVTPGDPRIRTHSLSTLSEALTAYGNDVDYPSVFSEQLRVLGAPQDLLIAISASGSSPNIVRVVETAREIGMKVVTLTGFDGGTVAGMADVNITVPLYSYEQVEDAHSILLHMVVSRLKSFRENVHDA